MASGPFLLLRTLGGAGTLAGGCAVACLPAFSMRRVVKGYAVARLRLSGLTRMEVHVPRGEGGALRRLGRIHMTVFDPDGRRVVGFLVKRPDVAGMVKRSDRFVALDALERRGDGLVVTDGRQGMDSAAKRRLGLDWDRCVMWIGMDARTTGGRKLGIVSDAEIVRETGQVVSFFVGDGVVAETLVGALPIPADMLRGCSRNCMVVDPAAAKLALSGGVAARAGEGYAKAKAQGSKVAKKVDARASRAVAKGSRALGRQLGKTKGMFGSFMDEYKKARDSGT